jgi:hypothetical protein
MLHSSQEVTSVCPKIHVHLEPQNATLGNGVIADVTSDRLDWLGGPSLMTDGL